ncbi:MAG: DUF349 domain-containing protein [Acidobacteria bacterium]|nr:MAG: DUF349 domain-containing protein [Acidobacteriota bacterium]
MGLFDKFRAQPRWKHSNPATRTAAVEELPLDQQDTLVAIAREDRDPGVRIAALRKVLSPTVIAEVGGQDADHRVREEATTLLLDLAIGAFEGTEQGECLAALAGLTDPKHLLTVARTAANDIVARAALDRLQDPGALGSVARKAGHAGVRLEAVARLDDAHELAAVALRSEFKDATIAAVERLTDRVVLEDIAARAKNKTAAKRARALVRAIDEAAATKAAAEAAALEPILAEEARRREAALAACRRLERLPSSGLDDGEALLAEIDRAWVQLAGAVDQELAARFAAARPAAEEAIARQFEERAERTRAFQAIAEGVSARRGICEQIDGFAGDQTMAQLGESRAAWAALEPLDDAAESARWQQRFDDACRACEARHRALVRQRESRERAEQICGEIERLAGHAFFPQARGEWQALRRGWNQITATGFDDQALHGRFTEADTRLQQLETEARERRARAQQENLERLEKLCAEVEGLAAAETLTLKAGERATREIRAALDDKAPLPARQDHERIDARLEAVLAALAPRMKELRELDEWQRWANAGVQEELCQKVEALMQVEDLGVAAKQLRELQAQWKQVAIAPRDQSQVLWNRFKAATDAARARCDVYYAQQAEQQAAHQARKEALCQQAEALSGSSDWIRTAEAIKALQAEWKIVGPAPRAQEKALWDRFHAACDAFFTRRRDDLQSRKELWAGNLARKEALCAQAEAVAETTEWQKGIEEIKRLQAEWKEIGPVRKAKADVVWARFRAACDHFFERYQQRDQVATTSVLTEADAVLTELEALAPAEAAAAPEAVESPEAVGAKVAALRRRWASVIAALPRDRAMRMGERFTRGLARAVEACPAAFAGTDLDPEAAVRAMEELCVQVERLLEPETQAPAEDEGGSPATLLARQLREALATNTIAGRPDEGNKWKVASEQVRQAQAAWKRIGPAPEAVTRALNARFHRACARFTEQRDAQRRGIGAGR